MVAAEVTEPTLHASLLVGALLAQPAETRLKQVVGAERDEAVRLLTRAPAKHPRHGALVVVHPDLAEDAAEVLQPQHHRFQKGLLRAARHHPHEDPSRVAGSHLEEPDHHLRSGHDHGRLEEVDFGLGAGVLDLRHHHFGRSEQLPLATPHVLAHGRLRHLDPQLGADPLPDPVRCVLLLARRLPVSRQHRLDERLRRSQYRRLPRWHRARRRQRRV